MPVQSTFSFGNFTARRGEMTLSHGITPSAAILQVIPGAISTKIDTLRIHGGPRPITFPDCAVDWSSLAVTPDSFWWSIRILDRRWKWRWPTIDGEYNIYLSDGLLDTSTEQTPRQLIGRLLLVLGETGFDISRVPDAMRVHVKWNGTSAAGALANLCDRLACRIVMGLDNKVSIWPVKQGRSGTVLQKPDRVSPDLSIAPSMRPHILKVQFGPTLFESRLRLRAVGKELNGDIKPINDLSYKPAGGWETQSPWFFGDVAESGRQLAFQTVYRWYQVYDTVLGNFQVPGIVGPLNRISQILPLNDFLSSRGLHPDGLSFENQPTISGKFYAGGLKGQNITTVTAATGGRTTNRAIYPGPWQLNKKVGVVQFDNPVFEINTSEQAAPCSDLQLITSYRVRKADGLLHRHSVSKTLAGGSGEQLIPRGDLFRVVREDVRPGNRVTSVDNNTTLNTEGNNTITAFERHHIRITTDEIVWGGIVPIAPDGSIQQVRWQAGVDLPTTRASINDEFDRYSPSYFERRITEQVAFPA